jgi:hypothetical protein
MIPKILIAFIPVVAFLCLLVLMDSFKLARPKAIARRWPGALSPR